MAEEIKNEKTAKTTRKSSEKNIWRYTTIVLLVVVVLVLVAFLWKPGETSSTSGISVAAQNQIANNAVDFLNKNIIGGNTTASVDSVSETDGIVNITVLYQGQKIPIYATEDGKLLILPNGGIIDMTKPLPTANQTQTANQATVNLQIPDFAPYTGSSSAKINIVEFADYQCPYCSDFFAKTEPQITQNYVSTGKVRYYFLDFAFLGPDSVTLADGAWCANDQGKYYDYHDYVYSHQGQEGSSWGTADKIKAFAPSITGLNVQKFSACLDNKTYESRVNQLTQLGQSTGVTGTPAFFIGNSQIGYVFVNGDLPYSTFQQDLDSQLAKA